MVSSIWLILHLFPPLQVFWVCASVHNVSKCRNPGEQYQVSGVNVGNTHWDRMPLGATRQNEIVQRRKKVRKPRAMEQSTEWQIPAPKNLSCLSFLPDHGRLPWETREQILTQQHATLFVFE
jgi:hypothetical protein